MFPRPILHGAIGAALLFCLDASLNAANWPAWRGPAGNGVTSETDLPTRWSATENVRWKVELPDRGNSTPIVWNNRIFITQAEGAKRMVICFDRATGQERWRGGPEYAGNEPTHPTNPLASGSPVTDGEHVIAWFGSAGLWCFDLNGKELWHLDLGKQEHQWGYGTSPVLHGDLCFLNFGPGERSFLLAVDKKTGKEVWRVDIPRVQSTSRTDGFAGKDGEVGSWSFPIVINNNGREELVVSLPERVQAYDPKTGKELWSCRGLTPLIYTSTVYGEGVVVAMSGFGGSDLAVKPGGEGDVTETNRLWFHPRSKQRIGSGVIKDGYFYVLNTPGVAQCLDLKTGESVWEQRLQGGGPKSESWSSLVLSGDQIYALNQSGDAFIFKAAPKFELVAVNKIDDGLTNASLAASDGDLFIRTHKHLWCIGKK